MLVDKFNRTVDLIQIEASGACQHGCSHCSFAGEKLNGDLFPTASVARFVAAMSFLGLRRVRLIGGEPLMRPDIMELIGKLCSIKSLSVSLCTNGHLLLPMAERLCASGLDRIFVTMPTLDRGLFREITGVDGLDNVQAGIEAAKGACGARATVKMTVLPGVNDHEIERVAEWAIRRGLDIYIVEAATANGSGALTMKGIEERLGRQYSLSRMEGAAVNNNPYRVEGSGAVIKIVTMDKKRYCGTCNRLWLSAAGKLSLCSMFSDSIDLKEFFEDDPSEADLVQFAAMIPLNRPLGAPGCVRAPATRQAD